MGASHRLTKMIIRSSPRCPYQSLVLRPVRPARTFRRSTHDHFFALVATHPHPCSNNTLLFFCSLSSSVPYIPNRTISYHDTIPPSHHPAIDHGHTIGPFLYFVFCHAPKRGSPNPRHFMITAQKRGPTDAETGLLLFLPCLHNILATCRFLRRGLYLPAVASTRMEYPLDSGVVFPVSLPRFYPLGRKTKKDITAAEEDRRVFVSHFVQVSVRQGRIYLHGQAIGVIAKMLRVHGHGHRHARVGMCAWSGQFYSFFCAVCTHSM